MLMHEVGIATSILEAAHAEVQRRPAARLVSIGVRVGVLAGVDIEALRFAFACIVAGTEDEAVVFVTEQSPRRNCCERCGTEFVSPGSSPLLDAPCPRCQCEKTAFMSGDELDLAFVEVEEG
jgi:hydrogenase nickel incorporation protein HypA/HybF